MGLLDKLIDKIIDGAKNKKTDAIVSKLAKENPEFAKVLKTQYKTHQEVEKKLQQILKKKGLKP
jgi:predicted transcriptional regulator